MYRINSIGIIILMIVIAVGCSSSQEKSSVDPTGETPAMDVAGDYQFINEVSESNCWAEGLATMDHMESKITITQTGSTLKWSKFGIGEEVFVNLISSINGNKAEFNKMVGHYLNSRVLWNATIEFSDTGFHGDGDYRVPSSSAKCQGIFSITGTRIK